MLHHFTVFAVAASILIAAHSCASPPQSSDTPVFGNVLLVAEEARALGKREATLEANIPVTGRDHSFSQAVEEYSLVVVRPARLAAATTAIDRIRTWHVFRVIETTSYRRPLLEDCEGFVPPVNVTVGTDEVAMELFAGSVDVAGTTVRMQGLHSLVSFEPDQTYLLLGTLCPNRTMILAFGPWGVYRISPDGFIPGAAGEPGAPRPFLEEMLKINTLDNLKTRLRARN